MYAKFKKKNSRRIYVNIMVVLLSKTELLGTFNIWDQITLCWAGDTILCIVGCLATFLASIN